MGEIPAKIELLEAEQANIHSQLANVNIYKTHAEEAKALQVRLLEIDNLLENLLARWAALDSK